MGFGLLVIGVALWWAAHLFKRLAPGRRAALGAKGRGLVSLALLASVVLMVLGYRAAPYVALWDTQPWMIHVNNLLVLVGLWMMSPAGTKGRLLARVRHPMLAGFRAWAAAHVLVNGELGALILFGGLFLWAIVTPAVINRAEPAWTPRAEGSLAKDAMFAVASVVLMAVIGYVHAWLGYWPFPGSAG